MSQAKAPTPANAQQRVTRQVSFAAASQSETGSLVASPSAASMSSDRTAFTWMAAYGTRARPEEPESFPYAWKNIASFPRRLFRPSACETCYEVDAEQQELDMEKGPQSQTRPVDTKVRIGKPRTFKKTPLNRVKLREVLEKWVASFCTTSTQTDGNDSRYQPPLTRKEFTNYLNWEERSSENQSVWQANMQKASSHFRFAASSILGSKVTPSSMKNGLRRGAPLPPKC